MQTKFAHPSGAVLNIAAALFDRGFKGKSVDEYTRPRNSQRIFSCYGSTTPGQPIVAGIKPMQQGPKKTRAVRVGTDTAKGVLYARLKLQRHGPRYMHFPQGFGYDLQYFKQLVSEREVVKFEGGRSVRRWVKQTARNEALDKRIYAMAALEILKPNFDALQKNLPKLAPAKQYVIKPTETASETKTEQQQPQPQQVRRRLPRREGGFVGGWRR
jgi:phage terminase large subunit GpA-like protein